MLFQDEGIELAAVESSDGARLMEILNTPSIAACLFGLPAKAAAMGFDVWLTAAMQRRNDVYFSVKAKGCQQPVGLCAYQDIDYRNGSVTIWAAVQPEYGCGAQVLRLLCKNAFSHLRAEHVALLCLAADHSMSALAAQVGFTQDAVLYSRIRRGDERLDQKLFTLLKGEETEK